MQADPNPSIPISRIPRPCRSTPAVSPTVTSRIEMSTANGNTAAAVSLPGNAQSQSSYQAPGPTAGTTASKDTSWFKKACKEAVPLRQHFDPGDPADLTDRGLTTSVGTDKIDAVFINSDQLWNGTPQTINCYFIRDGQYPPTDAQMDKVRDTIKEWELYANVHFFIIQDRTKSDVRISFDPNDGSWSYVGRQNERIPSTSATMNLAWIDKSTVAITPVEKAVILHEFGHVLGLLHEHQSPAHGGTAVVDIQAAIDLYSATQGWTIQQIYSQVISVYAMKDVSNFSQVDIHSIMHYPEPKELTGLPEDIPYNLQLDDLDKAYMILQYPRTVISVEATRAGWSYEKALTVIGAPDDVRAQVLGLIKSDRDQRTGEINPINIRQVIEKWTRAAHAKPDTPNNNGMSAGISNQANAPNAFPDPSKFGKIVARVREGYGTCATGIPSAALSGQPAINGTGPAHAVNDALTLIALPDDTVTQNAEITYIVRVKSGEKIKPYQNWLIEHAMQTWSSAASVQFVSCPENTSPALVIEFQNTPDVNPDSETRSFCIPLHPDERTEREKNSSRFSNWDALPADIVYHNIFEELEAAELYQSPMWKLQDNGIVDGVAGDTRTVIHELGHWLGLEHESSGLYGYMMDSKLSSGLSNQTITQTREGSELLFATLYDAGSVMDEMGILLTNARKEVLQAMGLNVTAIQEVEDKTRADALSFINLYVQPTLYDTANVALLYPGMNLVSPSDEEAPGFHLKPSPYVSRTSNSLDHDSNDGSLLQFYLQALKLDHDNNLESIANYLRKGQWRAARRTYLGFLRSQQINDAPEFRKLLATAAEDFQVEPTSDVGVVQVWDSTSSKVNGLHPGPEIVLPEIDDSISLVALIRDGESLCDTKEPEVTSENDEAAAIEGVLGPAHAAFSAIDLYPTAASQDLSRIQITYYLRARHKNTKQLQAVTPYQRLLVEHAMQNWTATAAINFTAAVAGTSPSVVIDIWTDDSPDPENGERSSTVMLTDSKKTARVTDASRFNNWNALDADIDLRNMFTNLKDAEAYRAQRYKSQSGTPADGFLLNTRSAVHELGHWLGLKHEKCGLYGYMIHRDKAFLSTTRTPEETKMLDDARQNILATRYDTGSVMDVLGLEYSANAARLLQDYGLGKPTLIEDKTSQDRISRVNVAIIPSRFDLSNIALLYPGDNLVEPGATPNAFTLKRLEGSSSAPTANNSNAATNTDSYEGSALQFHIKTLKLDGDQKRKASLIKALQSGDWRRARLWYSIMVQKAQEAAEPEVEKLLKSLGQGLVTRSTADPNVIQACDATSVTTDPSKDVNGSVSVDNTMDSEEMLQLLVNCGLVTGTVDDGDALCANGMENASSTDNSTMPAHGVTDLSWLSYLPDDGDINSLTINYVVHEKVPATPLVMDDGTVLTPVDPFEIRTATSPYQLKLIKAAMAAWSGVAAVNFQPAATATSPDLVIQFNNDSTTIDPLTPIRSLTKTFTGRQKYDRRTDTSRATNWNDLTADIEYNGIFDTEVSATQYTSLTYSSSRDTPINGMMFNLRSVIHELGHWLGLHHEFVGYYGQIMRTKGLLRTGEPVDPDLGTTLFATRYDAGSVMDVMGLRINDEAIRLLRKRGLTGGSDIRLTDNTRTQVIHRIALSLSLSKYDQANIALLYPGSNLVTAGSTPGSFVLKQLGSGTDAPSLLRVYLQNLCLYTPTVCQSIETELVHGRWGNARRIYLDLLQSTQTKEAPLQATFLENLGSSFVAVPTAIANLFEVYDVDAAPAGKPAHDIEPVIGVPQHALGDSTTAMKPIGTPVESGPGSFIWELYHKLQQLYSPGGGQYFALQFPTRYLDKQSYAYKLDGYFSRFDKPVVVNEAEFALTDQLYPTAAIVGGPNGQSLSKNYEKALNALIPTFESLDVRKQREKMRAWLLKETKSGNAAYTVDTRLSIPGITAETAKELSATTGMVVTAMASGEPMSDQVEAKAMALQAINAIKDSARADPRGMTRMEYSESLMQVYLNDRKEWELRRDAMIKQASDDALTDPLAMEKLTRTLAHITAIEEAKLAAKYSDAVVRGYSHTVRGFMGHLDIKSTAEALQDAKDSFRESALSSVYAASKVYPVSMQPTDWFEALDTSFTREDLSQDPELIKAAVKAKSQLVDALEDQIANLRAFYKGDPADAKRKMDQAAADREEKIGKLSQSYTASTISAVKLAIQVAVAASSGGTSLAAEAGAEATLKGIMAAAPDGGPMDANKKSLTDIFGDKTIDDIGKQLDDVAAANTAVNQASRLLTETMSEYSLAMAGDTKTMVDSLQRQLTTAKTELANLQESFVIATRAPPATGTLEDEGKLPQGNGGSRWSELHIEADVSNSYTSASSSSSSSVSSFNCNFWIGSYSSSSGQSQASNETASMSATLHVAVNMRTTYVTVDRAGWFDPSLLDMSKSFMRGADPGDYVPWAEWVKKNDADQTMVDVANAIVEDTEFKPTGYLATFPVGYVLVKDCVINITSSATDMSSFKKHFDQQSQSSGGFLCFSHSSASGSSEDTSASTSRQASNGIVVRIPGPQILGYVMQVVGKDNSQPFKATPDSELFVEDMDDTPAAGTDVPQHDINSQQSTQPTTRQMGVRSYDSSFTTDSDTTNQGAAVKMMSTSVPARDVAVPGDLNTALETALSDSDVAKWLDAQPGDARKELMSKLQAAFGKAVRS